MSKGIFFLVNPKSPRCCIKERWAKIKKEKTMSKRLRESHKAPTATAHQQVSLAANYSRRYEIPVICQLKIFLENTCRPAG